MSETRPAATAPAPIAIQVNGEAQPIAAGTSVAELVASLGLGDRRVAVAVNREVVRRGDYASARLAAGDRVEILEAVGGG